MESAQLKENQERECPRRWEKEQFWAMRTSPLPQDPQTGRAQWRLTSFWTGEHLSFWNFLEWWGGSQAARVWVSRLCFPPGANHDWEEKGLQQLSAEAVSLLSLSSCCLLLAWCEHVVSKQEIKKLNFSRSPGSHFHNHRSRAWSAFPCPEWWRL